MYSMDEIKEVCEGRDVVIIDVSNVLYRNFYTFQDMGVMVNGHLKPTGSFYGISRNIIQFKETFDNPVIFMVRDGIPKKKHEKIKEVKGTDTYKAGRERTGYNVYHDLNEVLEVAQAFKDVYVCYNPEEEFDDVGYSLAKQLDSSKHNYIYSTDGDMLQCIDDHITVFKNIVKNQPLLITEEYMYNDEKYQKKFKRTSPSNLPLYRAIVGDTSDNLPGPIPRFPKDLAAKIAKQCTIEDIQKVATLVSTTPSKFKYLLKLQEEYKKVELNYEVMKLQEVSFAITREEPSETRVREMCDTLRLGSFWRAYCQEREE